MAIWKVKYPAFLLKLQQQEKKQLQELGKTATEKKIAAEKKTATGQRQQDITIVLYI